METTITESLLRVNSASLFFAVANPLHNLSLGYSIIYDRQGKVVKSISDLSKGDNIDVQMADGIVEANVKSKKQVKKYD
jgi:exodeoxyribonuclease VII large subunit